MKLLNESEEKLRFLIKSDFAVSTYIRICGDYSIKYIYIRFKYDFTAFSPADSTADRLSADYSTKSLLR